MSQQTINTGLAPNDGTGDKIRVSFNKVNSNFDELYAKDRDLSNTTNTYSGLVPNVATLRTDVNGITANVSNIYTIVNAMSSFDATTVNALIVTVNSNYTVTNASFNTTNSVYALANNLNTDLSDLSNSRNVVLKSSYYTMGSNSRTISYNTSGGLYPPDLSVRTGERIVLWNLQPSYSYSIGMETNGMWFGVDEGLASAGFRWYKGNTEIMHLSRQANLRINTVTTNNVVFATGTQTIPWTGTVNSLNNGGYTLSLGGDGVTSIPDSVKFFNNVTAELYTDYPRDIDIYTNHWEGGGVELWLRHDHSVHLSANNGTFDWNFHKDGRFTLANNMIVPNGGSITFGDSTVQRTAFVGEANTLDGQDGSYYLNYGNFTSTPDLSVYTKKTDFNTNVSSYLVDGTAKVLTGNVTINGSFIINGNTSQVIANNVVYTDNLLELHTPGGNVGNTWGYSEGKDIGLRMHYYNGTDKNAALILANDTKYLEWYIDGVESAGVFSAGEYGDIKANNFRGNLVGTANNTLYVGEIAVANVISNSSLQYFLGFYASLANLASVNAYTNLVVSSANSWANAVGVNANTYSTGYANTVVINANTYAGVMANASNAWANVVGSSGNAYVVSVGTAGNVYASSVGTSANVFANTVGLSANNYAGAMANAANAYATTVGAAGNNYTLSAVSSANNYAGAMANTGLVTAVAAFSQANAAYAAANAAAALIYNAGQIVKMTMLSNSQMTVSTTTASATNYTTFASLSYTPSIANSYLVIECQFRYAIPGSMSDDYYTNIQVDTGEISYTYHKADDTSSSGLANFRSSTMSPIMGRFTNTNTTAKNITIGMKRGSADDTVTIFDDISLWVKITEIAR